jgi:hypothetical protein
MDKYYGTNNYISLGVTSPDYIDSTPRIYGDVQEGISPELLELYADGLYIDSSNNPISDTFLVRSI